MPKINDTRVYRRFDDDSLKKSLSPLAWRVTQEDATEPPFRNAYWDNHDEGIYVDSTSGEPLFSSLDKFDSGTGWPSFVQPINGGSVVEKRDVTHGMVRVEARSKTGNAHLGHVFDDGPRPTGLRYCMNSASLRFIPRAKLEAEGYGAYAALFGGTAKPVDDLASGQCAPDAAGGPGCASSFETIVVTASADAEKALRALPGVVEVSRTAKGVEVVFDPAQTSADVVRAGSR